MAKRFNWRKSLVKRVVFFEGGARGEARLNRAYRKAFQKLFTQAGVKASFEPCFGRAETYRTFCKAIKNPRAADEEYYLLVDSEDEIADNIEKSGIYWRHVELRRGDTWDMPDGVLQDQLLFMVTCIESWIMADPFAVTTVFKRDVQENALLATGGIEQRGHREVIAALEHATRNCSANYGKGKHAPALIEVLDPQKLSALSHWNRCVRILGEASGA
jgi:Domain of unknown function (DUF4276)